MSAWVVLLREIDAAGGIVDGHVFPMEPWALTTLRNLKLVKRVHRWWFITRLGRELLAGLVVWQNRRWKAGAPRVERDPHSGPQLVATWIPRGIIK